MLWVVYHWMDAGFSVPPLFIAYYIVGGGDSQRRGSSWEPLNHRRPVSSSGRHVINNISIDYIIMGLHRGVVVSEVILN